MEKYLDKNSVLRLLQGIKTQIDKSKTSVLDTKGVANGIASLDAGGNVPLSQLGNLDTTFFEVVTELPTDIRNIKKHIYILKGNKDGDNNKYAEYIYTGDLTDAGDLAGDVDATKWEKLGDFVPTFDLQEYVKKNGAVAKLEFHDPRFDGALNGDDDAPFRTAIRIGFADGSHKYLVVPEAEAPIGASRSNSESSDEIDKPFQTPGCAGFMSASDKGKLDKIDLNALTASINAANTAADNTNKAIKAAETATTGAEKVDATLTEENVFEVTGRTGVKKTLDMSGLVSAQSDVARIQESMGAYSDRPNITLVAKETNKAISADGVKVTKAGWAIAEFIAEKGNIYLFKPNEVDGDVCIFAEEITNIETRGIDYTYTYNADGTIETAKATYLGATHIYTFSYAEDKSYTITDEAGETVEALPMTYETKVGSYSPLVRLNADAELPIDGYCRYMSHFKGNSSIKIVVSYKIDAADLVMKVVRDGVFASISTQLGNLSQKEDETRKKIEDLHGSYIELMWNADSWCLVDGKWVEVKAFKKYRFKPIFSLETYRKYDATHYQNGSHLVYADVSHFDASKFMFNTALDGYKKQINNTFFASKIEKLDCRGMNVSGLQSINQIFKGCSELREIDIRGLDISECRTFSDTTKNSQSMGLFTNCVKLQIIYGLSGLDTRNIEDMSSMFSGCSSITNIDVSNFDTSKVTNMDGMFNSCKSLTSIDVSNFDTSNVTNMAGMFENTDSLQSLNISNFDTRKVTIVRGIYGFISSGSLLTLDMSGDNFTFENVTSFGRFIANTPKLKTLKLGKNFFKMHESITSLSLSYPYWTDSSVKLSLVTNLYDRRANGLPDLTLTLHANTKKVLSEDDMAAITAKGYIIA